MGFQLIMGVISLMIAFALSSLGQVAAAETQAARVAVFALQDQTQKLSATEQKQITEYLSSKLAEGGSFQLVPDRELFPQNINRPSTRWV
jgi:hypothetical protein